MKDAVLTVRLPRSTRKRLEAIARREGRSLSQQVERLLDLAMSGQSARRIRSARPRPLAGCLRGGRVPTLKDFREIRALLSASLDVQTRNR
jgi:hypothetical protein